MRLTIIVAAIALALILGGVLLLTGKAEAPMPGGPAPTAPAPQTSNRFIVCPGHQRCPRGVRGRIPDPALKGD